MLNIKLIPPGYRIVKGESIVMDSARKGKLLMEFTPRSAAGAYDWADQVRFALSAEEVGLFCSQLPQFPVEYSRGSAQSSEEEPMTFGAVSNDMPDKVLKISPGEGATVVFVLDFVRDGVGNQSRGGASPGVSFEIVTTDSNDSRIKCLHDVIIQSVQSLTFVNFSQDWRSHGSYRPSW